MKIRGHPSWIPTQGIGDKLPTPSEEGQGLGIGGGSSNIGAGSGDIKPSI
jgi:hypothetical protein